MAAFSEPMTLESTDWWGRVRNVWIQVNRQGAHDQMLSRVSVLDLGIRQHADGLTLIYFCNPETALRLREDPNLTLGCFASAWIQLRPIDRAEGTMELWLSFEESSTSDEQRVFLEWVIRDLSPCTYVVEY